MQWFCRRAAAWPHSHFSPTASCCRPPQTAGSCRKQRLPAPGKLFPCNLFSRQTHKTKDSLGVLVGTSLHRILVQERRTARRRGVWEGEVPSGRIADWGWDTGADRGCLNDRLDGWTGLQLNGSGTHISCRPECLPGCLACLNDWIKLLGLHHVHWDKKK